MRKLAVVLAVVGASLGFGVSQAVGAQLYCNGICSVSESGGAQHSHTVALVGDSITYESSNYIRSSLRSYHYTIDAITGQTMAEMYPVIQQLVPTSPYAWVVELGTNDARFGNANWSADFSKEVSTLASQRCVVLLSVNPRLGSIAAAIDQAISSTVASQSNFHELDWGNIEWQNRKWVSPDGIHPGPQGSAELAKLMRLSVHNVC